MALVLVGKALVSGGWPSKIEDTQVPGWYITAVIKSKPCHLTWVIMCYGKNPTETTKKRSWRIHLPGLPSEDLDNPNDERSDELAIVSKSGRAGLEDSLYINDLSTINWSGWGLAILYWETQKNMVGLQESRECPFTPPICPHKKGLKRAILTMGVHLVTSS